MSLDTSYTPAMFYICRLLDAIDAYECQHGKSPKYILASQRAYLLLQHYANEFYVADTGSELHSYFRGIEIRAVSGDGYDVFLVDAPVVIGE